MQATAFYPLYVIVDVYVCEVVCVCTVGIHTHMLLLYGLPGGSEGKESTCNARDTGDMGMIPGLGRSPGGGSGNPLQYACWEIPWTEEPQGLQSRGHKKLDMTEVT